MKNNLMVDLETLSLRPDAHILSIGAVWFDPNTGEPWTITKKLSYMGSKLSA